MSANLIDRCEKYFATRNLYAIFDLADDAGEGESKRIIILMESDFAIVE